MKKVNTSTKTPVASKPATPVVSTSGTPATAPAVKVTEPVRISKTVVPKQKIVPHLFDKDNLKWMLIGLVVIAIGFILMAGGKSSSPNVFQDKDVYSFRRITIAPILIIAGFIIEIFAIMRKPDSKEVN